MIHRKIRESLTQAIRTDKVFHAYVFSGPEGIGKRTLARDFAMALHCQSDNAPCGVCPECVKHKTGNHPDYRELVPEKDKKNISVDALRAACNELYIRPLIADRKILFIPEADLCEAGAQNALLKCFEEPPPYATILLAVRDLSALLATIRSRAVIYTLNPCSREEIKAFVTETYPKMAEKADFIADFSGGVIGRAAELCRDDTLSEKRRSLFALLKNFPDSRYAALKTADFLSGSPEDEALYYELCLSYFRDVALIGQGSDRLIHRDYEKELRAFSDKVGKKSAARALYLMAEAKNTKAKYANYGLFITDLLSSLWEVLHD